MSDVQYDAVIVGAGVSGNTIAMQLGLAGKKVLILEAGPPVPDNREEYMENFYLALAKTPESPYPKIAARVNSEAPLPNPDTLPVPRPTVLMIGQDASQSYLVQPTGAGKPDDDGNVRGLQFSSTYERIGGGTAWHWLGTSLRLLEHDIKMASTYDVFTDWPVTYEELQTYWAMAEKEIGVAASVKEQKRLEVVGLVYPEGYQYPMQSIPISLVDRSVKTAVSGLTVPGELDDPDAKQYEVFVTPTPQGRNSEPYDDRRVCAGNTNCIPICPIQAKWDPTVTLGKALNTGNVTVSYQSVAVNVAVEDGAAQRIDYIQWSYGADGSIVKETKSVTAKVYVLAAHAIENAKLLLLSNDQEGIANRSKQVGCNLMDHVLYLSWALAPQPVYGYRGPLATAGIESLRDGEFRRNRAAFRMEIGNEGWNFPDTDPYTTTVDFITGSNRSQLNPGHERLGGLALVQKLNGLLTRQFRIGCLMEQAPQSENRVTLDPTAVDGLGIPRPKVDYGLDEYTMEGFRVAKSVCSTIYQRMGATEYTTASTGGAGDFTYKGENYHYFGAGHVMGTHRMGTDPDHSVVDAGQRSHDVQNLWITGSGSFPTVATANPTLTLMALAFKSSQSILSALGN